MAEYDNAQLYSNYQSYHKANDDDNSSTIKCSKNRIAWNNKRKKINSHYDEENMTKTKCQRPNNNFRSEAATRLIATPSSSGKSLRQTSLITNRQDNNNNKSVIMRNNKSGDNNESLNDDNIIHRRKPMMRKYFSCYNKSNAFTLALLVAIGLLFKINLSCGFILVS